MLDLTRENKVAGKEEWENKIVGVVNPMERHQGTIKSAEFIPGETGIFFSMDSRRLLIWDTAQMVVAEKKKVSDIIPQKATFRPNGKQIAICGEKILKFYDLNSGSIHTELSDKKLSESKIIGTCAWSNNNNRHLAVGMDDQVRMYDIRNSKRPFSIFRKSFKQVCDLFYTV